MPDYIARGLTWDEIKSKLQTEGAFNIVGTSIDDIASKVNNSNTDGVALVFNGVYSADFVAKVFDNPNISSSKVAEICDNPNISSSKLKAVLDSGILTNADKIAAILDGDSLTADDAASHIESGVYSDDLYASAFDSAYLSEAKLQAILDSTNLSIQRGQRIVEKMSDPSKIGTGGRRGIIGDDWEDNKLTSRDNASVVASDLGRIVQTFRREWTAVEGTITVINGRIEGDAAGANRIQISSSVTEGTWEVDIIILSTGSSQEIYFIYQDSDNFYVAGNSTPAGIRAWFLRKTEAGSSTDLIRSSWTEETGTYRLKVTRDSAGNFELFVNGVSKGTATETWLPSNPQYIILRLDNDGEGAMDNLEVY